MKYRGKKMYGIGGEKECYDAIGNVIPCPGQEMTNTSDNGQWMKTATPNVDAFNKKYASADIDAYKISEQQGAPNSFQVVTPGQHKKDKVDPLFALMGATDGLSWLSGTVERRRQNQYMNDQFHQLNQMNPMPADDFQPNPFSLYSKYGGKASYRGGGNWIQGAVKHPGRCTPGSPNYDCPEGSPQWNLAQTFKKHNGFHRGKK